MMIVTQIALIFFGVLVPELARINKKPLPPIPTLGLTLVPVTLGYQFVRVEMFTSALKSAVEKSGPDCELAVSYRAELTDARARIDRLQRIIDASGDAVLRTESERRIAQCLSEYREGLTMTPMQRYERAKRMHEETDRKITELNRTQKEKTEQRIKEYFK